MLPRVFFAAAAAAALVAPGASAQARPMPTAETSALGTLHEVNQFETTLGTIAETRGATASTRRFGALLRRDHRLADDDISRTAKRYGFSYMPPAPPERVLENGRFLEDVRAARGRDLDRRLLDATVQVESGAARSLRELRPRVSQKDVGKLIDRALPILEQHIVIARDLEKKP